MAGRFARYLNGVIAPFAPAFALQREVALTKREMLQSRAEHYQGAGRGPRGKDFRANRSDAVEAMRASRSRLSWVGRDMLRNNPRVVTIQRRLRGNVIGAGIRPNVKWLGNAADDPRKARVEALIRSHCLSTSFDADGLLTLLGMQGLAFASMVVDGEVLLRRRYRRLEDGYPLNFQVQVLEADYLDANVDGDLRGGNYAVQGVEFNRLGQRVAYHLHSEHPGGRKGYTLKSTRVDARNVIHLFDVARAGAARGVSWFAPVITHLHDLHKYQDGQIKRQEVASMFAGILTTSDSTEELEKAMTDTTLTPGGLMVLGDGESMTFSNPPAVDGYREFMSATDRTIAAAMGITYEALTGDYSNVNYSSGRMGRMDVDPMVKDWQDNLMIARGCARIGAWVQEAIADVADIDPALYEIGWTPPVRPVVDPTKDYKADETAVSAGQKSRRQVIRERGQDPQAVEAEILEERAWEKEHGVSFGKSGGGTAASEPASDGTPDNDDDEEKGGNDDKT
ncbi:MAG: phage portal protein [Pseudooceanicola sp.]|nr:phage portal protein [Pseudooceanicola sp.]